MVALADLQKASMLAAEKQSIAHAIEQLSGDGRIVAMTIAPKPAEDMMFMPVGGVQVNTAGMDYPQQMVDSIKQQFTQRQTAIEAELAALGVTTTAPTEPAAEPDAQAAMTARERRRSQREG